MATQNCWLWIINLEDRLILVRGRGEQMPDENLEDNSILAKVKKQIGLLPEDHAFDIDIITKLNGVKNIQQAKSKGAQIVPVNQITFASPVFVQAAGTAEPALSGAVAATGLGKFSAKPVKGNGGVYMFQVKNKKNRAQKYAEKDYMQRLSQRAMQMAGNFMQELYIKADIKDNRYLFF